MTKQKKPLLKRWIFWVPVSLYMLLGLAPLFIFPDFSADMPKGVTWHQLDVQTSTGSHTLKYARAGTEGGMRVVLVHGTPGDAGGWAGFLDVVPEGVEYIAVDRLGFAGSEGSGAQTSLTAQAESLEPFLGEDGAVFVGHSLGGPIVAKVAALYPERVKGIVIAAGSLDPNLEEINPLQYLAFLPPFRWTLAPALYNSNLELLGLEPELENLALELDHITCPVEILHGTADSLVPYANVPFMQRKIMNAPINVVTFEGVDHFLPWTNEQDIRDAIDRLVAMSATPNR